MVAWESGARPIVVLTKLDVAPAGSRRRADDPPRRPSTCSRPARSRERGSTPSAPRSRTRSPPALLGPSGSGKSTLVNALLGEERLAVGDGARAGRSRASHHHESAPRAVALGWIARRHARAPQPRHRCRRRRDRGDVPGDRRARGAVPVRRLRPRDRTRLRGARRRAGGRPRPGPPRELPQAPAGDRVRAPPRRPGLAAGADALVEVAHQGPAPPVPRPRSTE